VDPTNLIFWGYANRGNRRLTWIQTELIPSFSPVSSVVRQITDKRKVVPARFILDSVNLNPHKVEADSPGKRFPLVNFNRRAVA
jgi:hypothetical protein